MIGLGRAYAVEFHNVGVAAQQDLFYVKPAADKICVIEAVYLSNVGVARRTPATRRRNCSASR
jgi:hypothetical protein